MILPRQLPSVTGIIPATYAHGRYLPRLLLALGRSTHPYSKIIIVATGWPEKGLLDFERQIPNELPFEIKIEKTTLCPAGTNRNIGLEISSTAWVDFLDADDLYSIHRLETMLNEALETGASVVAHSYAKFRFRFLGIGFRWILDKFLIYKEKVPVRKLRITRKTMEPQTINSTNITTERIHHAHILLRLEKLPSARFSETAQRNEDALFLRQLIRHGEEIIFLDLPLSSYFLGSRFQKMLLLFRKNRGDSEYRRASH